jgi:hypothetical protein
MKKRQLAIICLVGKRYDFPVDEIKNVLTKIIRVGARYAQLRI